MEAFLKTFTAAMIGGYIGHKIDQTRFGYWYNTNPVITWIYRTVLRILFIAAIVAVVYFFFFVFFTPTIG